MNTQQLDNLDNEKLRNYIRCFSKKYYNKEAETLDELNDLCFQACDNFEQVLEKLIKEIDNNEL